MNRSAVPVCLVAVLTIGLVGGTARPCVAQTRSGESTTSLKLSQVTPDTAATGSAATNITLKGSGFTASSKAYWNGTALTTSYVSASELTATVPASDLATAGIDSVTVESAGTKSSAEKFTVANGKPSISSISPTSATTGSPATTVTVNGSGFVSTSKVEWKSAALATTYVSSTTLTAVIPAADLAKSGTETVTVVNPAPGGGTSKAASFSVGNAVPSVTSISPNEAVIGSAAATVAVTGTGFNAKSVVKLGSKALKSTYVSGTELTATVPATSLKALGTFSLTVVNAAPAGGTSGAATFYVVNPTAAYSQVSANSTTAGSGATTITIEGSNFLPGTVVDWNGAALATKYISASEIQVTIPSTDLATGGTYNLTIVNPGPTTPTTMAVTYTVDNPAPTVAAVSPSSVTQNSAATTITVTGTNFVSSSVVEFNGAALTTRFISSTKVTATVPVGDLTTLGTFGITVVNPSPGGGTSSALDFSVTVDPVTNAKEAIGMLRGLFSGVVTTGGADIVNVGYAFYGQYEGIMDAVNSAAAFGKRFEFVSDLIGMNGDNAELLHGLSSGTYTQVYNASDTPPLQLVRTGNAADGKSWIVTCDVSGDADGLVFTVTPTTATASFSNISGGYTFSVTDPSDTSIAWSGTVTSNGTASTHPTSISATGTLSDSVLTSAITFSLTWNATVNTGGTNSWAASGSISSQWGTISVTNFAVDYYSGSHALESVTLGNFTISSNLTPTGSLTVASLALNWATPTSSSSTDSPITNVSVGTGEMKGSGYDAKLSNFAIGFTEGIPSSVQATLNFTSPQQTFQGSVSGTLNNPSELITFGEAILAGLEGGTSPKVTTADFPIGSLNMTGSFTPTSTNLTYAMNVTLSGALDAANTGGVMALTVNNLQLGSETLVGALSVTFGPGSGGYLSSKPSVAGSFTFEPGGSVIALSNTSGSITGTISLGSTVSALIGAANSAGIDLPDLGGTPVILYSDDSFETLASLLL